jgi:hypothetical protein
MDNATHLQVLESSQRVGIIYDDIKELVRSDISSRPTRTRRLTGYQRTICKDYSRTWKTLAGLLVEPPRYLLVSTRSEGRH